jgi:hypothetical protein
MVMVIDSIFLGVCVEMKCAPKEDGVVPSADTSEMCVSKHKTTHSNFIIHISYTAQLIRSMSSATPYMNMSIQNR